VFVDGDRPALDGDGGPELARDDVRLARRLRTMPVAVAAFAAGDITDVHARRLAGLNAPDAAAAFADAEDCLVDRARTLRWCDFVKVAGYWLREARPDDGRPTCRVHHRLHSRRTGMADIRVDDIDIHIPGHADTSSCDPGREDVVALLVGTSGWQYADWRGALYPEGVPKRAWLERYAGEFPTVEVNNAFYRLPERSVFARWRDETPDGFVVAVKVSRYLTHVRRLRDPDEPVARLLDRAAGLGDRLGPCLLQLPPTLRADVDRLEACLAAFPSGVRVAVEPRHDSWWSDDVRDVLERHDAALCWADRAGRPITPLWRTAGWGYVRLHEGTASPPPSYGRRALATWLDRVDGAWPRATGADVFVYFNNDLGGAAVRNARTLRRVAANRAFTVAEP
jgi:uncharacterized protein YecE (DUF72 family)